MPLFPTHAGFANPALFASPSSTAHDDPHAKSYDYIIAGGGTAGCVLASRLSEDPAVSVLLIEAGDADTKQLMSKIPAGWGNLFNSPAEWGYKTVPQEHAAGRKLYQPRGKMLGGCSAINAQIYQQCSPEDYDDWEKNGAKGWGWDNLKPYFDKAAGVYPIQGKVLEKSDIAAQGFLKTSFPIANPISQAFVKSGLGVSIPTIVDFNTARPESNYGASCFLTSASAGVRTTTSTAYLPPSTYQGRPNLSILTCTTVTRLLFSPTSPTQCIGVQVGQKQGVDTPRWVAFARRDVVVAMGAFASPQLLLASGIGARAELEKAGVEVLREVRGVGKGLKDHVWSLVTWEAQKGTSLQFLTSPVATLPSLAKWLFNGTGALATNVGEAAMFLRSDAIPDQKSFVAKGATNASGPTAPDLEIICAPLWYQSHGLKKPPTTGGNDFFTLGSIVLRPKSVGTVTLASSDMFDAPVIDPNYLSHELDRKVVLEGVKLIRRLAQTEPLKSFLVKSVAPVGLDDLDDEGLMKHVSESAETIYHPVSTCKIGMESAGGVVDSDLRVHGIKGLRVCDASVFPDIVAGHPQAAVIAVAERFADLLKSSMASQAWAPIPVKASSTPLRSRTFVV
ncbi:hypothetical protein RQP46_005131 [Phenoliferia psychrophenolica]